MTDIVKELTKKYGLTRDDIWPVPGGRAHAIRHAALERIAAECGILFDHPQIIEADSANKVATIMVTARMGERVEWTFGEASPANCKNAYTWAMAEKRGKDRCILKLLNAHGALYSEDELDQSPPPRHAQEDPFPGDAPRASANAIKTHAPELWAEFERTMRAEDTAVGIVEIKQRWKKEISGWPVAFRNSANALYDECKARILASHNGAPTTEQREVWDDMRAAE